MERRITTLNNSKYKKDYNKYFTIGDYYGDSHEIGNTELSDETFEKIFDVINTIVVIFPKEGESVDGDLAHRIRLESGDSNTRVKDLLDSEKLTFHAREFHKPGKKGDCRSAINFFEFKDYQEIIDFLGWQELDKDTNIEAFTTIKSERPVPVQQEKVYPQNFPPVELPKFPISDDERTYLDEVHFRFLKGEDNDIKPFALTAKLWRTPPKDFKPEMINGDLLIGGSVITPLGIYHVDPNSDVLRYIDPVLGVIKDMIHETEGIAEIRSEDVHDRIPQISLANLFLTFKLIYRMQNFTTGISSGEDTMSLKIDTEICYNNILDYISLQDYYTVKIIEPPIFKNTNDDIDSALQLDGLVVNDSTDWFEDAKGYIESNGAVIVWWNKLPTGIRSIQTLDLLNQTLEEKGYFEIHYCSDNKSYYRAKVVKFATDSDYDAEKWRKEYPRLPLLDKIQDYTDERGKRIKIAKIVFVARLIEKVDPKIPISEFIFPPRISPPVRNNLQPYIRINSVEEEADPKDVEINTEAAPPIFISENVDGVIGVKEYSKELTDLLVNLKNETGLMVGLFGRWGRGKTFFWNQMKEYLKSKKGEKPFFYSEFHSWKYQDTPASWAYLYEELVKSCLEYSEVHPLFRIKRNVLRMNIAKYTYWPIVAFLFLFLFTVSWFFLIPLSFKVDLFLIIIGYVFSGALSIAWIVGFYKIYANHLPKAVNLFRKYSEIVSFKDLLGFQSEIQEELIKVLNATLPNLKLMRKRNGKLRRQKIFRIINARRLTRFKKQPRVLLFVDDIDRCSENKIIQIIDSLKVMLEDKEISKRIVVLTAIDERVLKRAIKHKYFDLVSRSCSKPDDNSSALEILSREYMDKLFIGGMKLSSLTENEKVTVFDAFSRDKGNVNLKKRTNQHDIELEDDDDVEFIDLSVPDNTKNNNPKRKRGIVVKNEGDENFEIENWEYLNLKSSLSNLKEATPRAIRIFYYRYLLAKRIMKYRFPKQSSLRNEWDRMEDRDKQILADLILFFTQKSPEQIKDHRSKAKDGEKILNLKPFIKEYKVENSVVLELYNVIETIVPY